MRFLLFASLIVPAALAAFLVVRPVGAQDAGVLWQQENDAAIATFQNGDYAGFLRAQDRVKEAETMEARAAAIP